MWTCAAHNNFLGATIPKNLFDIRKTDFFNKPLSTLIHSPAINSIVSPHRRNNHLLGYLPVSE